MLVKNGHIAIKLNGDMVELLIKPIYFVCNELFIHPLCLTHLITAFPQHGEDLENRMQMADKALYRAKEEGRNRIVIA
jgi:GGDEF domain-containing protein